MRQVMSSAEWQHWRVYFLRRQQERELAMEQARG